MKNGAPARRRPTVCDVMLTDNEALNIQIGGPLRLGRGAVATGGFFYAAFKQRPEGEKGK